jgi:membrane protein required for colicin V production
MGMIDLICIAVVVISMFLGALRGLVYAVLSILGWGLAVVCARWLGPMLATSLPWTHETVAGGTLSMIAGYVLVFVTVAFVAGWIASQISQAAKSSGFGAVDRVLGGLFGALRAVIILIGVVVLVEMTPVAQNPEWTASPLVQQLSQAGQVLKSFVAQKPEKVTS